MSNRIGLNTRRPAFSISLTNDNPGFRPHQRDGARAVEDIKDTRAEPTVNQQGQQQQQQQTSAAVIPQQGVVPPPAAPTTTNNLSLNHISHFLTNAGGQGGGS
jgi:hypothetical protein